jgi:hypothetical protein
MHQSHEKPQPKARYRDDEFDALEAAAERRVQRLAAPRARRFQAFEDEPAKPARDERDFGER